MPARPQLVIWSKEEGSVGAIRFSSAIQSSPARPSSKLSEDSRARASEGLSVASRQVGDSAILGVGGCFRLVGW